MCLVDTVEGGSVTRPDGGIMSRGAYVSHLGLVVAILASVRCGTPPQPAAIGPDVRAADAGTSDVQSADACVLDGLADAAGAEDGSAADAPAPVDVPGADVPPPGSLAACATLYRGFDTCCEYDAALAAWFFVDAPCPSADQCAKDVDCPAGYVEIRYEDGTCPCRSPLSGTCREEDRVPLVGPGESCPPGRYRCPWSWPDDGRASCSSCRCETRGAQFLLVGDPYCPDGEDRARCPCHRYAECCLGTGSGLYCGQDGEWELFWDCPCVPGFGCEEPLADLCQGVD